MMKSNEVASNRILVCDDDKKIIAEYVRCLSEDFIADVVTATLSDLEKVLFGDETNDRGAIGCDVETRDQGETAVEAVRIAVADTKPFSIVFLDIRMPPGIDGIEAAKRIRELDPNINIVIAKSLCEDWNRTRIVHICQGVHGCSTDILI